MCIVSALQIKEGPYADLSIAWSREISERAQHHFGIAQITDPDAHERNTCRDGARAAGARVVLCFLDVPFEELWNRLSRRNTELATGTFHVARADLLRWSKLFEPPTAEEIALYDRPNHPAITALI